jgi:hypothetical protein
MRLYRSTMSLLPIRLTVGEQHDDPRCTGSPVRFEFFKRRMNAGSQVRTTRARHISQSVDDFRAVGRHGQSELTATVEADDADLDIASRRQLLDQTGGAD